MGEIAGERSQGHTQDRTDWRDSPVSSSWSERAGGGVALVDAVVILSLLPVLSWVVLEQHATGAGLGALTAFGALAFALLRGASSLPLRTWARRASVPMATATAGILTLVLWRSPAVGFDAALRGSVQPWLVVTACLVTARVALAMLAPRADTVTAAKALDRALKRALDLVASVAIIVFGAPIAAVVAIAIWLEDRGPVFYRCERFGAGGHKLDLLKFRKMRPDAGGPPLTATDDDRFTRVGRFLARSKLDEVPQLWNVLKGEMSLVGPRPEDLEFVKMYPDEFAEISRVRPGITGLCQLAFAKEAEIIEGDDRVRTYTERYLPAKVNIDLLYVERRSLLLDLKILIWTALVLLRVDIAVNRQTGELTLRRRG